MPEKSEEEKCVLDESELIAWVEENGFIMFSEEDWVKEYQGDVILKEVVVRVRNGWGRKTEVQEDLRPYYEVRDELTVMGDHLCGGRKIIPPKELRGKIIRGAHEGHLGMTLTKRRLRDVFWWPAMDREVERCVRDCNSCMRSDKILTTRKQPLQPIGLQRAPWVRLGIDILGPYRESREKCVFLIVIMDHYTKWPEVKVVNRTEAKDVISFLNEIFRREGVPEEILSDNGTQFRSNEMESFAKEMGIRWIFGSNYHPETNGLVERMNRVLSEAIQLARCNLRDWRTEIWETIWSYRTTPHTVTGMSPFCLMRGREPGMRFAPKWLLKGKKGARRTVECSVKKKQEEYKERYDSTKGVKKVEVAVGDLVKIKKPEVSWRKGESKYSEAVKVIKVMKGAVRVEGGKLWNLNRVVRAREGNEAVDRNEQGQSWFPGNKLPEPELVDGVTRGELVVWRPSDRGIEDLSNDVVVRRSGREVRPPVHMKDYITYV